MEEGWAITCSTLLAKIAFFGFILQFQWFLTVLSGRPGRKREIVDQRLPKARTPNISTHSSLSLHPCFTTPARRWLCHRSRHCFPPRSANWSAMIDHSLAPRSLTNRRSNASSSPLHTRFFPRSSRTRPAVVFSSRLLVGLAGVEGKQREMLWLGAVVYGWPVCSSSAWCMQFVIRRECRFKWLVCGVNIIFWHYNQMEQTDRDFWQAVRCFLLRYAEYNREKGASIAQVEEFQQTQARLLAGGELKEAVMSRLAGLELKCDYHNLIMLSLLQDLAKWSQEHYGQLKHHPAPLDCILAQSLTVLAAQQQFHTIVPKQNELIALLLAHPHTLEQHDHFRSLYRRLKDVKEFYPAGTRDHQKQCFLRAVEESIDRAALTHNLRVLEFIFNNIFNELESLEDTHEYVSQRLRILRRVARALWNYHQDILHRLGFLLMRLSYQVLSHRQLFAQVMAIYEEVMCRLLERPSMLPLLLFRHVVHNNVQRLLEQGGSCILLQALLAQLARLFTAPFLTYFMRHYDWNFLELPVCQQALNLLHQYTEQRAHEGRPHFQLVRLAIARIHASIKQQLEGLRGPEGEEEQKWKFYQLKRKDFQQLLAQLNEKPKKVLKRIEQLKSDVREATVGRCVRLVKKSAHLQSRAMIDILATDHPVSAELFAHYVAVVLRQCRQHDLEQFMRLFTSNFFLTGESQQIARVLDTITQLYYKAQQTQQGNQGEGTQGAGMLKSSDATYTFANAILILNTDLHNPKNEEKISEESFLKMCKKINDGEDLPVEVLKRTYANIKRNKINTFRDRSNMLGISLSNWLIYCSDYEALPLAYYDPELALLSEASLHVFIHDSLATFIDEKETAKLEALVERFLYDDRVFECQIIETLRRAAEKKPHLPLHILTRATQLANFPQSRLNDKTLSYYWLTTQLITTFPSLLPTTAITELLISTWAVRAELQDNLYLRQAAELRRVRRCTRWMTKREAKRSIMDMFSNFLSFKDSDSDPEKPPAPGRAAFRALSNSIFDVLKYVETHRLAAVEFLMGYIHGEESRQYQEFVGCLFLLFNLLYAMEGCDVPAQDLFYELLGAKQSAITRRLGNLAKKDIKLHDLLISYCRFWILKLLLKEYAPPKLAPRPNNNYHYMLTRALPHLARTDPDVLQDLIKELLTKPTIHPIIFEAFRTAITRVHGTVKPPEVQQFFDKFANQPGENLPQQQKQEDFSSLGGTKSTSDNSKEPQKEEKQGKKEDKKEDEKVDRKEESKQAIVKQDTVITQEQDVIGKQKEVMIKQGSISELEYVNPDEEMNKVEEEIETHMKALLKQEVSHQPEKTGENQKEKEKEREAEQEETPSIPVVMF